MLVENSFFGIKEVINLVCDNFGEIGNLLIEDDFVSFEVYRGDYEEAPKMIKSTSGRIGLSLTDKFDDPFFLLGYKIISIASRDF